MKSVIALIGPSGSGKSSVGERLAANLNWAFIDSDREIERREGRTVPDIFQNSGEAEFRRLEAQLLEELASSPKQKLVLSTGGGLPVFGNNLEKLESFAVTVYLTASLEVLVTRLKQGEKRPLLATTGTELQDEDADRAITERLGKLIASRESIYKRAQYKIDTSSDQIEQLVHDITRLVEAVIQSASSGKDQ